MPELPWDRRARLVREYGVKPENAEVFVADKILGGLFEEALSEIRSDLKNLSPRSDLGEFSALVENYITSDLVGLMKGSDSVGGVTGKSLADLVTMIKAGDLSSRGAKDTLAILYAEGGHPHEIAKKHNLIQKNDIEALKKIVAAVISANPTVVADYKSGKIALLQFLVGQGMKESKGAGNPGTIKTLFEEALK